jgi:hypothetical protein
MIGVQQSSSRSPVDHDSYAAIVHGANEATGVVFGEAYFGNPCLGIQRH